MEEFLRQRKERALWDKLASRYDRQVMGVYKKAYMLSVENVLQLVSNESQILEIGCGTGIISLGLAPHVDKLIATDISPKMISVAKYKARERGISNVDFHVCDGYCMPFADCSFHIVLLFNTLHFVKDPEKLIKEAYRLLKTGGHLALATDCLGESLPFLTRIRLVAQNLLKTLGIIPFMWNYRKEDLHSLLEENSFLVEDSQVLHPVPVNYYLLGRKV